MSTDACFTGRAFRTAAFLTTVALTLAGCKTGAPQGGPCINNVGCNVGLVCNNSICTTTCKTDSTCPSGYACGDGFCGKSCTAQSDCSGTEACGLVGPNDTSATCYPVQYTNPSTGGFGTNCSTYSCTGSGSTCGNGFQCVSQGTCDPNAICSTTCTTDLDCPANFFCADEIGADGGSTQLCLPRQRCDPCGTDDQCNAAALGGSVPGTYLCAPDNVGTHFCGKTCNSNTDCLHGYIIADPSNPNTTAEFAPFETCQQDSNGDKVCTPVTGACYGKSALSSISGNDTLCSPCRPGIPSDCGKDSKGNAVQCSMGPFGELSCLEGCTLNLTATSDQNTADICEQVTQSGPPDCWNYGADSCPTGTYCFFGGETDCFNQNTGAAESCQAQGVCSTDPMRQAETCYVPPCDPGSSSCL